MDSPTLERADEVHEEEKLEQLSAQNAGDSVQDKDVEIIDWEGPNDPDNPFNWATSRKLVLTAAALVATLTVLTNGTSITVAARLINEEFGISDATFPNSYWPIASWTLGGGVFMMLFLPLMEETGIRISWLVIYVCFILFLIGQALAQNFATLIIIRFFEGGCVNLVANASIAIICDIWEGDHGRAIPMAMFVTIYLASSSLGPVFGAAVIQYISWRWILWIHAIWAGILFPFFVLTIRETRGHVILKSRAERIRSRTGKKVYTYEELHGPSIWSIMEISIKRPISMACREFVIISFTLWSSFAVGLAYLFTQSVGQVYSTLYGWSDSGTGYVQAAIVIGEILGCCVQFYQKKWYLSSASRNKIDPGVPIPEARLYSAVPAAFIGMAGGMFVYAWTSYPHIHWIAPTIGLAMVGFGSNVMVMSVADYVTDCYSKYAGSAIAVVAFGENVFSAFLPLCAQSMYSKLGFQWASSLLAFIALVLGFVPIVLLLWGPAIRRRSPFMKEARYEGKRLDQLENTAITSQV